MMTLNNNPRNAIQTEFPEEGSFEQIALFLLQYAVLAPSSHNTQPWKFEIENQSIRLFADTSRALPVSDCYNRGLVISCGAALGNLEVAANYFGLTCNIETQPDDRNHSHLATIKLSQGHQITINDRRLFAAITERATSRKSFSNKPLPSSLFTLLEKEANNTVVNLKLIQDPIERGKIAELVAAADQLQFDDDAFRDELSNWIRSNNSQQHDGISANGNWKTSIPAKVNAMIIRRFDVGNGIAAQDKEIASNSPVLAVLSTNAEEPDHWLATGQLLSRLLLQLTDSGISVGYLNQAIEIHDIRDQLQDTIGIKGFPQLLLRLGKAEVTDSTSARRPLDEVVTIIS